MANNIGDIVRVTLVVTVAGVATDPATVTLHVRKPGAADHITSVYNQQGQPYTIVKSSTGNYYADIPVDIAKTWRYEWVTTGPGAGAEEGSFAVEKQRTRG
jgi:hypothetical protein